MPSPLGLLLLTLALGGQAPGDLPPRPAAPQTARPVRTPDELNADIARRAPAFGGFFLRDGALHVVVTSADPAARQAAVRELFAAWGDDLRRQGYVPEDIIFVPGEFGAAELLAAKEIAGGIPGGQSIDIDETRNRVVVELLLPGMEGRAQQFLDAQDLPRGIVVFRAPPPGHLPTGPAFTAPHRARLDVPARVARGDVAVIHLRVTTPGPGDLVLEHGSCPTTLEIASAATGEVVLPIPGALICTSDLRMTRLPAGGTVTLATREWNLRGPEGELVPPGRYVVRAAFEVGAVNTTFIRPPEQVFEVTPRNPRGGAAEVRDVLQNHVFGSAFRASVGEERDVQVVNVAVPDLRAKGAVERLLRERSLPLTRVRFHLLPPVRVPRGTGSGGAEVNVGTSSNVWQTYSDFEVSADLSPWRARGAWRCQAVVNVVDPRTGEVVAFWPGFDLAPQPPSCAASGPEQGYLRQARWDERRTDGTRAPTGTYEVRAGVRLTLRGGQVVWLLARPAQVTVR